MKIKINSGTGRNNFHNVADMYIIAKEENFIYKEKEIVAIKLTPSQILRIKNYFCGIKGCLCNSGPSSIEFIHYDKAILHLD